MRRQILLTIVTLGLAVPGLAQVPARQKEPPKSFTLGDTGFSQVDRKVLSPVDTTRLMAEDSGRGKTAVRPGPQRFAVAAGVNYTLENSGTWQNLSDGRLWRLRIQSPGAKSHNLGITRFDLPEGAKLWIYDPGRSQFQGPYTARNRSRAGSLWTAIIEGDEIVVELFVPTGAAQPALRIAKVNRGYRAFYKSIPGGGTEGTCNNDVICALGDPWRNQISAVGAYTLNGTAQCTGTLLNDVPMDGIPYFLSANHCAVNSTNDATVVVYWNYESATCGTHGPGSLANNQSGAIWRAGYAPSDFLLLELQDRPATLGFNIFHAGWDATPAAATMFTATVGIHHPRGDVKAISFSNSAPQPASWTTQTTSPTGNHWQISWNSGVTEGGSSGSCIFETTNGRCIGQLHGGPSICGGADLRDFYGMLGVSWIGGATNTTRLSNWLNPGNTGAIAIDGDPHIKTDDGVHYDFQGAGEFVSVRDPDGAEIQVRQATISTTFNPGADPYDGIAVGVSLNTAVAARVGTHRVTYQPNLSGVPDPSGLQLRVDGVLKTLGPAGIDLGAGGRIISTSTAGGLQIDFPNGRTLFVTPGWWASQSKWYLNVDATPIRAMNGAMQVGKGRSPTMGIAGAIAPGSWLPALPNGASLGPMPATVHQRYVDLYQRFGEAWRVTDSTTLFDYAPGTSTQTFTVSGWPSESGPWVVSGQVPVTPTTEAVARQACRAVREEHAHRNCVFDVRVTGNLGFAATYTAAGEVTGSQTSIPGGAPRLAAFLDLGAGIPSGAFSSAVNTGISFNAGLEYILTPRASVEAIAGYHHFSASGGGSVNVYQLSANAKVYLRPTGVRPFVNAGAGMYKFSPGQSKFGANAGAGVLYEMTPRFGLQASYNFHTVSTAGTATRFSTVQGGVRFVF